LKNVTLSSTMSPSISVDPMDVIGGTGAA